MAFTNFKMSQNDQHLARYFFDYVIRDLLEKQKFGSDCF